jgi:ABC-2 type transport system permease protein
MRTNKPRIFSLEKKSKIDLQSSVLLKKELWQFVREPSQWIHLGIITLLVLLFMASISHINLRQNMPFLQTVSYMVVLLFNSFLIVSIALRFVYPSMSIEGPNFWSILSAPVRRKKIFMLKYWLWLLPVLFLSELLVLFSNRSLMEYPVLVNSAAILTSAVACFSVSLNLGLGSYFADYKEKNPIRVASSQNATLIFLLCIIYLTILVASTFFPLNGFFGYILKGVPFEFSNLFISTGSFLLISLMAGTLFLIIGIKTMRRDY